jgi:5'-nucleotidase
MMIAALATALQPVWGTPASVKQAASSKPMALTLVALNDFHGNIMPPSGSILAPDADQPKGTRVLAGGAAYLSTLVRQIRATNPGGTWVVAAGDMVGASPLASNLFHDEPTIDVLNTIGLDFSSVGNHEFDRGRDELLRMVKGGCYPLSADGSTGLVGKDTCMNQGRFRGAKFQYLAANVVDEASGNTLLPAYAIRGYGKARVAFIGLTLKNTPTIVNPGGVRGLRFDDEVETVNRTVQLVRSAGATVVVVLIHQGGQTSARTVQDKSCPNFSKEMADMVDRFDPAVNVVVSGHTHQEYVCFRPDGKLVTQTGSYGRLVTRIDLLLDAQTGKVLSKDANNLLVVNGQAKDANGETIALPRGLQPLRADPAIERIVHRYGDLTASIADTVVGRVSTPLERRASAAGESSLGAVIADTYLAATSDPSLGSQAAQIAFTNRGGLRADLGAGSAVTFGELFSVLPFNNQLVTMTLTGEQIRRLLEQQWEKSPAQNLEVSQGFSYTWDAKHSADATAGAGGRVVPGSIALNGVPLEPTKTYRVAVNDFIANGGDGYTVLREGTDTVVGDTDLLAAKLYFRVHGVVTAPAPRITRLN